MARKKLEPTKPIDTDRDDDPVPKDPDEFCREFARRIASFIGSWRKCRLPLCKRARTCRGKRLDCMHCEPNPTPARTARVMAKVHDLVRRRLDEIERGGQSDGRAVQRADVRQPGRARGGSQ